MGLAGSDVAKDASDLVLTDDNFDSIRAAIAEGRRIFTNIQRFILHLLTTNVAQIIILVLGLVFLDDDRASVFPLSPLGVLWINMITGSPPAFGLGMEAAPPTLMARAPHSLKRGVFTRELIIDTFAYGICMGVTCLVNVRVRQSHSISTSPTLFSSVVRHCYLRRSPGRRKGPACFRLQPFFFRGLRHGVPSAFYRVCHINHSDLVL